MHYVKTVFRVTVCSHEDGERWHLDFEDKTEAEEYACGKREEGNAAFIKEISI